MSCKIKKEWSLDQGKKDYFLLTGDFGSLQMRLTCIDTKLDGQLDPALNELYSTPKPGEKKISDAHSMTGLNTFCKSVGFQMIDIEMEDGSVKSIPQNQEVEVSRNGRKEVIQALELKPDDEVLDI